MTVHKNEASGLWDVTINDNGKERVTRGFSSRSAARTFNRQAQARLEELKDISLDNAGIYEPDFEQTENESLIVKAVNKVKTKLAEIALLRAAKKAGKHESN